MRATLDPALQDTLARFRAYLVAVGGSAHTIPVYSRDVRVFAEWFSQTSGRTFSPGSTTPIDVREYRSYLPMVKKHKPATINRKLVSLSAFCKWAQGQELILANPIDRIALVDEARPAPKVAGQEPTACAPESGTGEGQETGHRPDHADHERGLRVSEVFRPRVDDLQITPRKGSVTVRGGKGEKSRSVPMNVDARKTIQAYHEERTGDDEERLFQGQRGKSLHPSGIYYLIKRYAYDTRLADVTPRTRRHTFGGNLTDAGVPLDPVAQLLGHGSIDTTRTHTTLSEQDLQQEVEKVALV